MNSNASGNLLLAIDVGNTNTVFALCAGEERRHVWRCRSDSARTADEYRAWLYPLFTEAGLTFGDVGAAIIASVVPDANDNLRRLCAGAFGVEPVVLNRDNANLGIRIALDRPEEVGADRIVNAAAVIRCYRCPAIVIDFGTATTFDVIDGEGAYCGGAIAPGIDVSREALRAAAAKLPRTSVRRIENVIGRSTIEALQSGIFWGYTSLIEGMIVRISNELGETPLVIATGGLADLFAGEVKMIDHVDQELTLRGLIGIYHEKFMT